MHTTTSRVLALLCCTHRLFKSLRGTNMECSRQLMIKSMRPGVAVNVNFDGIFSTLRCAFDTLSFQTPRTRIYTASFRAFSVFGPSTLNDLALPFRQNHSLDSFSSNLKTFPLSKRIDLPCFPHRADVFLRPQISVYCMSKLVLKCV